MCTRRCTQIFIPQNESNEISIEEKQAQHQTGIGGRKGGRTELTSFISPRIAFQKCLSVLHEVELARLGLFQPIQHIYFGLIQQSTSILQIACFGENKLSILLSSFPSRCFRDASEKKSSFHSSCKLRLWVVGLRGPRLLFKWSELHFLRNLP